MVINGQGWQNHEESFEETLRREMLSARQALWLVKMDLKELQKHITNCYKEIKNY